MEELVFSEKRYILGFPPLFPALISLSPQIYRVFAWSSKWLLSKAAFFYHRFGSVHPFSKLVRTHHRQSGYRDKNVHFERLDVLFFSRICWRNSTLLVLIKQMCSSLICLCLFLPILKFDLCPRFQHFFDGFVSIARASRLHNSSMRRSFFKKTLPSLRNHATPWTSPHSTTSCGPFRLFSDDAK